MLTVSTSRASLDTRPMLTVSTFARPLPTPGGPHAPQGRHPGHGLRGRAGAQPRRDHRQRRPPVHRPRPRRRHPRPAVGRRRLQPHLRGAGARRGLPVGPLRPAPRPDRRPARLRGDQRGRRPGRLDRSPGRRPRRHGRLRGRWSSRPRCRSSPTPSPTAASAPRPSAAGAPWSASASPSDRWSAACCWSSTPGAASSSPSRRWRWWLPSWPSHWCRSRATPPRRRLDRPGLAVSTAMLTLLTLTVIEAPARGLDLAGGRGRVRAHARSWWPASSLSSAGQPTR